ncbi:unnamed protein product, partial [Musa textilis]
RRWGSPATAPTASTARPARASPSPPTPPSPWSPSYSAAPPPTPTASPSSTPTPAMPSPSPTSARRSSPPPPAYPPSSASARATSSSSSPPTPVHFPVAFLAALSLGAIATTVNPLYTVPELTRQARDARAKGRGHRPPDLVEGRRLAPAGHHRRPQRLPLVPSSRVPRRLLLRPRRQPRSRRVLSAAGVPVGRRRAAVLLGDHRSQQGRRPDPPELHLHRPHGDGGPRLEGRWAEHRHLLPAHVPHIRLVGGHLLPAVAGQQRRLGAEVRHGCDLEGGRAVPSDGLLRRAAGDDRARQAGDGDQVRPQLAEVRVLRRSTNKQGCDGGRRQAPSSG